MDLGWLDVCLRVQDVRISRPFYEKLGFVRVEGEDLEGWAVMVSGEARIGLFEARYMGERNFTLNFRGGDIRAIAEVLAAQGLAFTKDPSFGAEGGGSATLVDPDRHEIFFDAAPGEVRKIPPE